MSYCRVIICNPKGCLNIKLMSTYTIMLCYIIVFLFLKQIFFIILKLNFSKNISIFLKFFFNKFVSLHIRLYLIPIS